MPRQWLPRAAKNEISEEGAGLRRVPVELHRLEPLERLRDQAVVLAHHPESAQGERLEIRVRKQESRRFGLRPLSVPQRCQAVEARGSNAQVRHIRMHG